MPYTVHHPRTRTTNVSSLIITLGIPHGPLEAHLWIVAGVEPSIVPKLAGLIGESARAVCALIGISQSTLVRKTAASSPLSTEQGARVYYVVLALDAALSLNEGDIVKCISWLNRPARGLGGEKPVNVLSTAMGVQAVIDLAGQIEHGVY
jgi:putative toxin-antitoxin system antitoxin component (TIGR02293 family)